MQREPDDTHPSTRNSPRAGDPGALTIRKQAAQRRTSAASESARSMPGRFCLEQAFGIRPTLWSTAF